MNNKQPINLTRAWELLNAWKKKNINDRLKKERKDKLNNINKNVR